MKTVRLSLVLLAIAAAAFGAFKYLSHQAVPEDFYSGYAEGEFVYMAAPIGGQLEQLNVQRGDQAKKGEVLFALDQTEEEGARAEAEEMMRESNATLDKAKLDYDRAKSLRDKRVTSPQDYDAAEQAFLSAQHSASARQKALDQADWRFTQKQQASPTSGLVYDTYYRPGEWVPAGTPVLSLLPPEYMKVRFFVPEGELGKFQIGRPLTIHLDGLDKTLSGKVTFVSPQAEYTLPIIYSRENRSKLVFLVEGSLIPEDAKQLHPGSPVEVRLNP